VTRALAQGHDPRGRSDAALERDADGRHSQALSGRPGPDREPVDREPTPAAVLVPLIVRDEGLTVLLTQRTAHLAHHPGQISFPGGRLEDCDDDWVACALRETEEEVGLASEAVSVLGRLDDYLTGTGFMVTPVVGAARPPLDLTLDSFEVAEVFEVPLDFLVDPANHTLTDREVNGRSRPFWSIPWRGRIIWGATAGILVNLADVLGCRGR
jgi:8-oxo-dGTP pyrophosphatase MutT (NUDIX family)